MDGYASSVKLLMDMNKQVILSNNMLVAQVTSLNAKFDMMSQQLGVVPPTNETMQMGNVDDVNDSSNGSDLKQTLQSWLHLKTMLGTVRTAKGKFVTWHLEQCSASYELWKSEQKEKSQQQWQWLSFTVI